MGIKDLWTILRPFGERKPLFELQGKTVAIDLSCWVCEAQNITEYYVQPQMYLRNLYFRTCYLLLLGVNPVYVLEGKPPALKYDTIASRNAHQFKGKKPKKSNTKTCKDRSHFNYTLKLCEEMLRYMGLICIKGEGEAEAMCAFLNENKFVDGCITQDSDCFAYGANTVYRNFSISQQGLCSANGGAIDEYKIEKIESSNGIGRNKIVALALLCGSDYTDGVFGVGKDSTLKLFSGVPDSDILNRIRSWRTNSEYYENLQRQLSMQNICTTCGHVGQQSAHEKNGCDECNLNKGCILVKNLCKNQKLFMKNELSMRQKALLLPNFPDEQLIEEYLNNKETLKNLRTDWHKPNIVKFIEFTRKHLQWEEKYAFEKFLMILSRWHLINYSKNAKTYKESAQDILHPDCIKKVRNPKGIPSYEIIWSEKEDIVSLIPSEQLESTTTAKLLTTIEPQHLVDEVYPDLVQAFKASKLKPKRLAKRRKETKADLPKKVKKAVTEVCNDLNGLQLNDGIEALKQAKINTYFQMTNTNIVKKSSEGINLDCSNFGDENDLDLSDVIDNILNYEQPKYIKEKLQKIEYGKSDESFFMKFSADVDMFEQTFSKLDSLSSSEDESPDYK